MPGRLNASDVAASLLARWPVTEYMHVLEAPLDGSRQGTKIDVAVIALWYSRRHQIDTVEIKVSLSDFRHEIEYRRWVLADANGNTIGTGGHDTKSQAERYASRAGDWHPTHPKPWTPRREITACFDKSAKWRARSSRFWIAVPVDLVDKVEPLMPEGWGLLACDGTSSKIVNKPAVNLAPIPLTWSQSVGLLRASADAGIEALGSRHDRGVRAGYRAAGFDDAELTASAIWRLRPRR